MSIIATKSGEELLGETIKGYVQINRIMYPKKPLSDIMPGEFGILVVEVQSLEQGYLCEEAVNSFSGAFNTAVRYLITIKGPIPAINFENVYYFEGVLEENSRFGYQYNIKKLHKVYQLSSTKQKESFLRALLGEHKAQILINNFEDPIAPLESGDIGLLTSIKGIGEATAMSIVQKYKDNVGVESALVQLEEYGLTNHMINKLQEHFKSIDTVMHILKTNPYSLIDMVDGISWNKADVMALNGGYDPCGENRIGAYIRFYLREQANLDGHSWIDLDVLVNAIYQIAPELPQENLQQMFRKWTNLQGDIKHPWLYYDAPTRRIGLMYYRKLEEQIAYELLRLQHGIVKTFTNEEVQQAITQAEIENGFEYTEEQRQGIFNCINNPVSILSGSAGCVDCETEFFNGHRWKKISEYRQGERVLQYSPDGTAQLVRPSDYIKKPADKMYLIQTKYGIDMCLSPEHNVYYITSKGHLRHKSMEQVKEQHENAGRGFSGKFITSFTYNGPRLRLTGPEIKLMIAAIADGSFSKWNSSRCRFHIKKDRKKQELISIFQEGHFEYIEKPSSVKGFTDYIVYTPYKEKEFEDYWYDATQAQLQLICDNILKWDGTIVNDRKVFFTSSKKNADFVQFAFSACGYKAVIGYYDRKHGHREYRVTISEHNLITMSGVSSVTGLKTAITECKPLDGYKYCFTVPTHMWVMRRNGKILITGNTGKTTSVKPLTILMNNKHLSFAQCALSGKASSNLSEITDAKGYTIHRLLKYQTTGDDKGHFKYNRDNPLSLHAVILDELSLVGGEIFLSLLQAIPTGCRLIMIGDPNQLEAIGLTNLLKDCVQSGVVPSTTLLKIHRQASLSGIITESLRVSAGQQIIGQLPINETRGALQDLHIISYLEGGLSQEMVLNEFKRLYFEKHISVKDICVVVPMRTRGNISCYALNQKIQEIVNGKNVSNQVLIHRSEGDYILRPGDKILITANHYHGAHTIENNEEVPIFNGNTGYITEIDTKNNILQVNLVQQGEITLPRDHWGDVELGYAITCHKIQGSASPYVIVGLDMGAYTLLSKEWLYTALTRAKKYCSLVTQVNATRKAVGISRVTVKQTWLQELLVMAISGEQNFMPENINKYLNFLGDNNDKK